MPSSYPDEKGAFFRYLTWSEEDERWQIVCTDAGHSEVGPCVPYPPNIDAHPGPYQTVAVGRVLKEYHIIYITKGRGIFETQGSRYSVSPGSVLLLFPGIEHLYRPEIETGWSEYWVGFRGAHIDALCRAGFLSPERPFYRLGLDNAILSHYLQILELVRNQAPLYQLNASALILRLIAEILSCERKAVQPTHAEELVVRAKCLMEENIGGDAGLNWIAESLGISASYLTEVFKSYTSMTPHQYFISIKIVRAKELLRQGLAVKEVAYSIGISDQYYFSRLFKNKTGLSPSRWKPYARQ